MRSTLSRIILSIVVGVVTWGVVFLIGLIIALIPGAQPIGAFIQGVSGIVGLIAGVVYFITGKTL